MSDAPGSVSERRPPHLPIEEAARVVGIALEDDGLRAPLRRRGHTPLTRYQDLTHVLATPRGLFLATANTRFARLRGHFADPERDPERVETEIRRRVAHGPGGLPQLARFAELDTIADRPLPLSTATGWLLALCIGFYVWERIDPFVETAGAFIPALAMQGELWRVVTGNLLHQAAGWPLHVGFNGFALLFLGPYVEQLLGGWRTTWVMAFSGITAMAASAAASYPAVVGASGIVSGLVGAIVVLELFFGGRVPANMRLPRRLLLTVVVIEGAVGAVLPGIAGWAHAGGYVGGALVAACVAGPALVDRPVSRLVKAGALATGLAVFLSAFPVGRLANRQPAALTRMAVGLLASDAELPRQWNEVAWRMATESRATPAQLRAAIELAERAVQKTDRVNPDLLDTLAETRFMAGDAEGALRDIEEAIALVEIYGPFLDYPDLDYFLEQRRRYLGERDIEDRPEAPEWGWPFFEGPLPLDPGFDRDAGPDPEEAITL